jgi:hypothetical protein
MLGSQVKVSSVVFDNWRNKSITWIFHKNTLVMVVLMQFRNKNRSHTFHLISQEKRECCTEMNQWDSSNNFQLPFKHKDLVVIFLIYSSWKLGFVHIYKRLYYINARLLTIFNDTPLTTLFLERMLHCFYHNCFLYSAWWLLPSLLQLSYAFYDLLQAGSKLPLLCLRYNSAL